MPVLPEEITAAELRRRWRGYDRTQVQTLLGRVGADYSVAIDRIADVAEDRARARTDIEELKRRLDTVTAAGRETAERARADAETEGETIRARAEHAAARILAQAEEAAAAVTRQAEALRAVAQQDADAARQRLEEADRRGRQLEDAARDRWDAVRAETENRFEQLQVAERRFAQRIRQVETTLGGLRSQVSLIEQINNVEQVLAAVRADNRSSWHEDGEDLNGQGR